MSIDRTIIETIESIASDLASEADSARAWVDHLAKALRTADDDILKRVDTLIASHLSAKQQLADRLHALSSEMGHLPPPRQALAEVEASPTGYPREIAYVGSGE